jgi:hypothetical protein
MAARKVFTGFAVLAIGVGVLGSVANAAPSCGSKVCSDEAAASGLSGKARRACLNSLISDCQAGLCSCTGGSPPCSCVCGDGLCGPSEDCGTCPQDCVTCPTIQCCVPGSPMGAFACVLETASDCSSAGGVDRGRGTCDPNPCCGFNGAPCCGGTTCFTGLGCSGGFCTVCPTTTTTTTLPLCDPLDPACLFNGVCTNGQTCGLDTNGQCACVGPPPTCGQWGIIACGGTCPAGEQCALENIAPPTCPQQVPVCHCVPAP